MLADGLGRSDVDPVRAATAAPEIERRTLTVLHVGDSVDFVWYTPLTTTSDLAAAIATRLHIQPGLGFTLEEVTGSGTAIVALSTGLPSGLALRLVLNSPQDLSAANTPRPASSVGTPGASDEPSSLPVLSEPPKHLRSSSSFGGDSDKRPNELAVPLLSSVSMGGASDRKLLWPSRPFATNDKSSNAYSTMNTMLKLNRLT
eukprot:scaffold14602_cov118-Isochrysis_galbana.AAC.6